jgi:hypothetical protein
MKTCWRDDIGETDCIDSFGLSVRCTSSVRLCSSPLSDPDSCGEVVSASAFLVLEDVFALASRFFFHSSRQFLILLTILSASDRLQWGRGGYLFRVAVSSSRIRRLPGRSNGYSPVRGGRMALDLVGR